jgi:hypothetical protein
MLLLQVCSLSDIFEQDEQELVVVNLYVLPSAITNCALVVRFVPPIKRSFVLWYATIKNWQNILSVKRIFGAG